VLRRTIGLIVRFLLGIAVIVGIFTLGSTMGWWAKLGRVAGPWLWRPLSLLLVAGGVALVVWGIVVLRGFIPRYRERRFLARLRADEVPVPQSEEEESFRQLQTKLLEAIRTLDKAPDKKKRGLALYATPWYLLIGASQSGKTALLRSVANSFPGDYSRYGGSLYLASPGRA
jgi:type VI protein secretion system component VasK